MGAHHAEQLMAGTPLVIGQQELEALAALKQRAHDHVLDVREILVRCSTVKGKRKHMTQMAQQTVLLPFGFTVTFSVESGHPAGTCLHLSMASPDPARVPTPEAVWMAAQPLGFRGGIEACTVWEEKLMQGNAINIVQPIPC